MQTYITATWPADKGAYSLARICQYRIYNVIINGAAQNQSTTVFDLFYISVYSYIALSNHDQFFFGYIAGSCCSL